MTAKGALAPHLAAQLAGRVLLRAAKDNNGGNRQLATGNWQSEATNRIRSRHHGPARTGLAACSCAR